MVRYMVRRILIPKRNNEKCSIGRRMRVVSEYKMGKRLVKWAVIVATITHATLKLIDMDDFDHSFWWCKIQ